MSTQRLGLLGVSRPPHPRTHLPVFPSQSLTDLSKDALAINLVFGENLTSLMSCWCPAKAVKTDYHMKHKNNTAHMDT